MVATAGRSSCAEPIRVTRHAPFQRGGDAVYFTKEESEAWLRRFDDREA